MSATFRRIRLQGFVPVTAYFCRFSMAERLCVAGVLTSPRGLNPMSSPNRLKGVSICVP